MGVVGSHQIHVLYLPGVLTVPVCVLVSRLALVFSSESVPSPLAIGVIVICAMSDIGLDSPRDGAEKKSVQICEDPNSKAHLEALFNVLNTGNTQEQPKTQGVWSGRKLPDSFFSPNKEKSGIRRLGPSISVGPSTGPSLQHNRSVSMPASFSEAHPRQFSLDSGPIPPGWEMSHTSDGLPYYIE